MAHVRPQGAEAIVAGIWNHFKLSVVKFQQPEAMFLSCFYLISSQLIEG